MRWFRRKVFERSIWNIYSWDGSKGRWYKNDGEYAADSGVTVDTILGGKQFIEAFLFKDYYKLVK